MIQIHVVYPEINKIIKPFIALAPVAYIGHVNTLEKAAAKLELLFEYELPR